MLEKVLRSIFNTYKDRINREAKFHSINFSSLLFEGKGRGRRMQQASMRSVIIATILTTPIVLWILLGLHLRNHP